MQALQGQLEEFLERTAHMERVENRRVAQKYVFGFASCLRWKHGLFLHD